MNNPRFIMTRGLPASGKSTWAEQFVAEAPEERVRINRDEIRFELYGAWYPVADNKGTVKDKENRVTIVEEQRIREALSAGKTVVSDNTNLNPAFWNSRIALAGEYGASVSVEDFPTPLEECLSRNANRERVVPSGVIEKMSRDYMGPDGEFHLFPGSYPVKAFRKPDSHREAIIFDADGTLWDTRSISHYVRDELKPNGKKKWKNFDLFHRSSLFVPPNHQVMDIVNQAHAEGLAIVIVTARSEPYREVTQAWLDKQEVPYENIFMRAAGDLRKDYIVKQEILGEILNHYDVVHAVDDQTLVIENAWTPAGISHTLVPGFKEEIPIGEVIQVRNPFNPGSCIRCGKPLKNGGIIGPRCVNKKVG